MKFKVGDKVRIRKDLKASQEFRKFYIDEDMLKYRGKIATIKEIDLYGAYRIDLDDTSWCWTEKMLEPLGKFFKKLPNNFTGTIEIENGYIIEKEILDEEEKKYLSAVIKPFKDRVISICKGVNCVDFYYILIKLKEDIILFPDFEKGTMYNGMEEEKIYTLKELGLDE